VMHFRCPETFRDTGRFGVPGGIRTHGPRIRNPVLYPAELRRHLAVSARQI
jgi:hypothetical protein